MFWTVGDFAFPMDAFKCEAAQFALSFDPLSGMGPIGGSVI